MAEALSTVILIGEIIWSLHDYARVVKAAKEEICLLSRELFALKGVLEYIDSRRQAAPDTHNTEADACAKEDGTIDLVSSDEFGSMLRSTTSTLQSLLSILQEPKGRLKKAMNKLAWPFTKAEFEEHVANLERVKSWFILAMMTDNFSLTRDIHKDIKDLKIIVKNDHLERKANEEATSRNDLLDWLAPVSPHAFQRKACIVRQPGTGEWFVNTTLPSWLDSVINTSSILWMKGKSGAGKTTLFSHVVETVEGSCANSKGVGVAYYYCAYSDPDSQKSVNALGSITAQLSAKVPHVLNVVKPAYDIEHEQRREKVLCNSHLEEAILKSANVLDRVIILVDAVNESFEQSDLVESLFCIAIKSAKFRIFITSTSDPPKCSLINAQSVQIRRTGMDEERHRLDIESYIATRLRQEPNLCRVNEKLQHEIETTLTRGAGGSFRWVSCQVHYLSKQLTGSAVRRALHHIPEDLNRTYEQMLLRIPSENREMVYRVLLWLSFAKRPLKLKELAEAVILEEDQQDIDDDDRLSQPEVIFDICYGLVTRDPSSGGVTLAHSSIRSFLLSDWIRHSNVASYGLDSNSANMAITRKCLTYLMLDEFNGGPVKSFDELNMRQTKYVLLHYAALFWALHARDCDSPEISLMRAFLKTCKLPGGGSFSSWTQYLVPGQTAGRRGMEHTQPLYYAASYNLLPLVRAIVEDKEEEVNLDAIGGRGSATALNIACFRGHYEVAKYLLEAGADPDKRDGFGIAPIGWAKDLGREKIFMLLKQYIKRHKAIEF